MTSKALGSLGHPDLALPLLPAAKKHQAERSWQGKHAKGSKGL